AASRPWPGVTCPGCRPAGYRRTFPIGRRTRPTWAALANRIRTSHEHHTHLRLLPAPPPGRLLLPRKRELPALPVLCRALPVRRVPAQGRGSCEAVGDVWNLSLLERDLLWGRSVPPSCSCSHRPGGQPPVLAPDI